MNPFLRIVVLAAALAAGGCATTGTNPRDPWEGMNRGTHAFNEALDKTVLKPVAKGYDWLMPAFAQEGVNNFFGNLEDIRSGLNNVLQGKPGQGVSDFGRVVVNSVVGIFGLWDIASPLGLEKHNEDFGQTLGVWGLGPGPYLVLPLLGPSTVRDAPAKIVDPSWFYSYVITSDASWGLFGLDVVRSRTNLFKAESVLDQAALDKYTFIRDAWLQRRQSQVYDGNPPRPKEDD